MEKTKTSSILITNIHQRTPKGTSKGEDKFNINQHGDFKPEEQDGEAAVSEILWLPRSSLGPRNRHSIRSENVNRKWIEI